MKLLLLVIFIAFSTFNLYAFGRREKMNEPQTSPSECYVTTIENTITLIGRVQVYGNEPHTFVGIVDENGIEYAVYPPKQEALLRGLQGHLIKFTVIMLNEPRGFGSLILTGGTVTPVTWQIIQGK